MSARRIVVCMPDGSSPDPSPEETEKRDVELVPDLDSTPAGVVGFAEGGWEAVRAAANGDLVDRLVLVSTPIPGEDDALPLADVNAKTLLLYGTGDPGGGHAHAVWWKDRLGGRIEMVPGAGRDILADVWPRVLSHLAPRRRHQD